MNFNVIFRILKWGVNKMTSQVLNFLWLNLDLPAKADPEDGSIRRPLPHKYIENLRDAGKAHPAAEIDLWIDSQRLTEKQMDYLKAVVEEGLPNVHVRDLRSIPAYDNEKLYNEAETNANWRLNQETVIWRQVDAAKILISLQGTFDQTFFADLDKAHLDIESDEVQKRLTDHGMFIGSGHENQLWGLDNSKRKFFEEYYEEALRVAYAGDNAWSTLCYKVESELLNKEGVPFNETFIVLGDKGGWATQPGHEWDGSSYAWKQGNSDSAFVSAAQLSDIFNGLGDSDNSPVPEVASTKPRVHPVSAGIFDQLFGHEESGSMGFTPPSFRELALLFNKIGNGDSEPGDPVSFLAKIMSKAQASAANRKRPAGSAL